MKHLVTFLLPPSLFRPLFFWFTLYWKKTDSQEKIEEEKQSRNSVSSLENDFGPFSMVVTPENSQPVQEEASQEDKEAYDNEENFSDFQSPEISHDNIKGFFLFFVLFFFFFLVGMLGH